MTLSNHPDLPPHAQKAISHLQAPVLPDHIRQAAQDAAGRRTGSGLPPQQQLAAIGTILKHMKRQLERIGCTVGLTKTDTGVTFHVDYPTALMPHGHPSPTEPLDDFHVGG
jgi:hypothetical protein